MITPGSPTLIHQMFTGKCSWFGGPEDRGMRTDEGLALIEDDDLLEPYFGRLFLNRHTGVGLGRALNPNLFYCAMRWDEVFPPEFTAGIRRETAREAMVRVTLGSLHVWVQAVDDGPGTETGRIIDLSPGALKRLHAVTDDIVTVEVFA